MLDNINRLSDLALGETSKMLATVCQSGSPSLLDECIPSSCPSVLGDAVMSHLDRQGLISDSTMQLFDAKRLRLTSVHITPSSDGNEITSRGLSVLKTQLLKKISFSGRRNYDESMGTRLLADGSSILKVLNDWTIYNLIELELPFNELSSGFASYVTRLNNLRYLSVASSLASFDSHSLETCLRGLPHLEALDISDTRVSNIEPLRARKDKIKRLSLYATQALFVSSTPEVLCSLTKLQYLDISLQADLPYAEDVSEFKLAPFLEKLPDHCPDVVSLDISGNQRLTLDTGRPALLLCASKLTKLKFIGAAIDGDASHWLRALDNYSEIKLTGTSSLRAILECLSCYRMRPNYLHHSLVALYNFVGDMEENEEFFKMHTPCLMSVVEVCHLWQHDRLVQLSGTASVYALIRGHLSAHLPKKLLCEVVKIATSVLEVFSQLQLVKNAVLLLCNDTILDCGADWLACASAVLYRLRQIGVSNVFIAKMSVLIVSVLASRLSAHEAAHLMVAPENWRTLLVPVNAACHDGESERLTESTVLRYCLSALWNLTDENPDNCSRFVIAGGLHTYCRLLKVYRLNAEKLRSMENDGGEAKEPDFVIDYEGKLLGLLNNVSEVPSLRVEILKIPDFVNELVWRLHQCSDTERHYFSGGIIANCLNQPESKSLSSMNMSYDDLSTELSACVAKWKIPAHEHVAYRSFRPFVPLLSDDQCPAVRHWALWALSLVATKNPDRYASMLKRDGIFRLLRDLFPKFQCDELSKTLATQLASVLTSVDDGSLAQAMESVS